jgi:hypothetical protein
MTKTPDKRVESTLWKLRAPSAPHARNVRLAMATPETTFRTVSRHMRSARDVMAR